MKIELQQKLYEKYPKIFAQKDLSITQTCMCWGVECGDGWYWLIDRLCSSIQNYCDNRNEEVRIRNEDRKDGARLHPTEEEMRVEASQVKEKFGRLRFYINSSDDMVYGMIHLAEDMSYNICEECGSTEDVKQTKGWITTLCSKCMKRLNKTS